MSKKSEYDRKYNQANKDKISERARQYYQANKGKITELERQRYHANKDKIRERRIRHRNNNGLMIDEKSKNYKPRQDTIDECRRIIELCNLKGRVA